MSERPQLDTLSAEDIVLLLLAAEERVVPAARARVVELAAGAELIAERMRAGGRLLFAGAGTSGRLAMAEAAELPGTFGLDRRLVQARVAGGAASTDRDEDDLAGALDDVIWLAFTSDDVLVAVAASGRTPYTLAIAERARDAGAAVIAVVNVAVSPLGALADIAVPVPVGEEVLRDSTRLTAGTAQKVVLNALTTTAMARLGRVHGDLMIDVEGANAKLRDRTAMIVADIAGCTHEQAVSALTACNGDARAAVLQLSLGLTPSAAAERAAAHPSLRQALQDS
ncbi:MAG: N-acetylmuramic acid 6-phosphate etherase [Jatrophihabitantaceae bacterium]